VSSSRAGKCQRASFGLAGRSLGLFATVLALALSSSCTAASDSGEVGVPVTTAPPVERATTTPTPTAAAPVASAALTPYTLEFELAGGYQVTATLAVTHAVLGTHRDVVEALWTSVGGSGVVPCFDTQYTGVTIPSWDTAAIAFGTLSLRNDTPGFTPPTFELAIKQIEDFQDDPSIDTLEMYAIGVQTSGGVSCGERDQSLLPQMSSETWGPAPVVFLLMNARSPARPNGPSQMPALALRNPGQGQSVEIRLVLDAG